MLDLLEVKNRILKEKDWQSRSIDIEIFHFQLMLLKQNKWSIRKTAKVLGLCASTVCEDLKLSRYFLKDPELMRVRRRCDALKVVRDYE